MSKELPQPQQSEEVDLGQLFKLIGNMFDRLFKFIGSIFNGIFKIILLILIHFYKRILWYVAALIVGGVIGFLIDKNSLTEYGANMIIETNFSSTAQVYENISEFHQLAGIDQDTLELAKRLNIKPSDAYHLKGFYIDPIKDENFIIKNYSNFYSKLDSVSRLDMTYDKYKESLKASNFRTHNIGIASTDKTIYKKIEKAFTQEISDNTYLNELLESGVSILNKRDKVLEEQGKSIDSLVKVYLEIRKRESEKETSATNSSTNVYMSDAKSAGLLIDESKVLTQKLRYENERRSIDSTLAFQNRIINVVSSFPKTGYEISKWYSKKKFVLPLLLFSLVAIVFMIIGLGSYLEKK